MEKLRIGIIGSGSRGIMCFGRTFFGRDDTMVTALCDPNRERMKAAQKELGDVPLAMYTDYREMLKQEPLDAVVVTSPDYLHADHIVAALQAGRRVLTDKPMATRAEDCTRIARACRETGQIVDMGFNLRHEAVCMRIKALIDEGAIGRVLSVDNRAYYTGGRTYMSRWNRFYEKSGGLFCHKGSHDFDLVNWFNPAGLPLKVSAFAGVEVFRPDRLPFELAPGEKAGPHCAACAVKHKCGDRFDEWEQEDGLFGASARAEDGYRKDVCMYLSEKDTHDNGIAIVEYDNGVRASHWECVFTPVSTRRFTVIGDRGHLDADLRADLVTVYPRWSADRVDYHVARPTGGHGGADPLLIDAFVRNVRNGVAPAATVRDGAMSVVIADAAERSRREGRTVLIEELVSRQEMAELFGRPGDAV